MAAENMIVDLFDDPAFWLANGCLVCGRVTEAEFRAVIQLRPAIYETVVVGPHRRSTPIISTIASIFFGHIADLAVFAVEAATQATERILVQEEAVIEFSLHSCKSCASQDDIKSSLANKLALHQLFLEMKEDFPAIRITDIIIVS
ncbi:MAG: hypothetical protein U1A77_08615 [Pirellulales bacterium]